MQRYIVYGLALIGVWAVGPVAGQLEATDPAPSMGAAFQAGKPAPDASARQVATAEHGYEIIRIDPPPGYAGSTTQAVAVNNDGDVLANFHAWPYVYYTAAIWRDGELVVVGATAGEQYDINANAVGVGTTCILEYPGGEGGPYAAVKWEDDAEIDLGIPYRSWPYGINDIGQIVGMYRDDDGYSHAFLWNEFTTTDLTDLAAGETGTAQAINIHGQVVGCATWVPEPAYPDATIHAAVMWEYTDGEWVLTQIGPAGSYAWDVNDAGVAVGAHHSPVLFTTSEPEILVPGATEGFAQGINEHNEVVGWYNYPGGPWLGSAFVWTSTTGYVDCHDLLDPADLANWYLWDARDINDVGVIVGTGDYCDEGMAHPVMSGFVLRPRTIARTAPTPRAR